MRLIFDDKDFNNFASPRDTVSPTLATGSKENRKKIGRKDAKTTSSSNNTQYAPKF
jgi:hypothetical protein